MGTDNLFHRRKAKKISDLARSRAKILPYDRVLIVCEGEKTEPNYFKEIRNYYQLSTANIEISGESGSSPTSVVDFAYHLYKKSIEENSKFDKVFCVIDRDAHADYDTAIKTIENLKPKGLFIVIPSIPCFEYWLLLHFIVTEKPYTPLPGNSSGHQVLSELRSYIYDYQKGRKDIFLTLIEQLDFAKSNSERILKNSETSGNPNPSTKVHELVNYLQNIKKKEKTLIQTLVT